jgi:hypothetical protein
VNDINKFIDTAQKYTAPASDSQLPTIDRSHQVGFGVELAQRMAAQNQTQGMPQQMPPITPVSN